MLFNSPPIHGSTLHAEKLSRPLQTKSAKGTQLPAGAWWKLATALLLISAFLVSCQNSASNPGEKSSSATTKQQLQKKNSRVKAEKTIIRSRQENPNINRRVAVQHTEKDVAVLPPPSPGEPGVTESATEAAASATATPNAIEVIPPRQPGQPGITQAEINAYQIASATQDPNQVEVIPPSQGEHRGITAAEIDAERTAADNHEPLDNTQIAPPFSPG